MTVAPWKAASPTEQSATQREVCLNHGGRLAEPQRGPAPGPDGSNSTCHLRELRVSARPQLHGGGTGLGAPAWGHRQGHGPHISTSQAAARARRPSARPCPGVPRRGKPPGTLVPTPVQLCPCTCPAQLSRPVPSFPSPWENRRGNVPRQPEKHRVSRNGRFPIPTELPVSVFKAVLKNTLKYSP